jgi:hypothetical protein
MPDDFRESNLNDILKEAVMELEMEMEKNNASIYFDPVACY